MSIFDRMSEIIRQLIDANVSVERVLSFAEENDNMEIDGLEEINNLVMELQELDEQVLTEIAGLFDVDGGFARENRLVLAGLNSNENILRTNIVLLPRFRCIWSGKSQNRNHQMNINALLSNSYYVEVTNGLLEGKYKIVNHILNREDYSIQMDGNNNLTLKIGVSPLDKSYKIKAFRFVNEGCHVFDVEMMSEDDQERIKKELINAIRKADLEKDKILVFPECMGTFENLYYVSEELKKQYLKNTEIVVFPSIWSKGEKGKEGCNSSYVLGYDGEIWFEQLKMMPFHLSLNGKEYRENIKDCEEIHLIHYDKLGSIAIAICRGFLEDEIRNLLIQKLNVKLILVPSWTSSESVYEFEASIMGGASLNCNTVWVNSCAAIKNDTQKSDIAIVSNYGKNREKNELDLENGKIKFGQCDSNCEGGCIFSKVIYGKEQQKRVGGLDE